MKQADFVGKKSGFVSGDPDGRLGACCVGSGVVPVTDLEAETIAEQFRAAFALRDAGCGACGGSGVDLVCGCGALVCDGCAVVRCHDCVDSETLGGCDCHFLEGVRSCVAEVERIKAQAGQDALPVVEAILARLRVVVAGVSAAGVLP